MAARFHLTAEALGPDGLQSMSPHWVLGFARWSVPLTYDVAKRASYTTDEGVAQHERQPLVVFNECISLTVTSAKEGHTMALSASFIDSGVKLLNEVLPGDWVVANVLYDRDAAIDVAQRMRDGEPVNHWNDGLKFVGRVVSVRKQVSVSQDGVKSSFYNLTAVAFSEFDTLVMYYPQLANQSVIPVSLEAFGLTVQGIIKGDESREAGGIDVNRILPRLMQAIFGAGAWSKAPTNPITGKPSPNKAYLIPETVAGWLNTGGGKSFADIMRLMVGVQKYSKVATASNTTLDTPWTLFQPDGLSFQDDAFRTSVPLMGVFPMEQVPQAQTTAWAYMSNYMNTPLNEFLTVLRADKDGDVLPFLVARQTPFTSDQLAVDLASNWADSTDVQPDDHSELGIDLRDEKGDEKLGLDLRATNKPKTGKKVKLVGKLTKQSDPTVAVKQSANKDVTRFLELPRWVVGNSLVVNADIGRSDATRVNLTFVYGTGPGVLMDPTQNFVRAPPIVDSLDVLRNGVRPYMPTINCLLVDLVEGPRQWRDIMADIVMGQHLTMNGSMSITGVRAPIAPGDNVEFEGLVYHIEMVSHSCNLMPDGKRTFVTTLNLSRGVEDSAQRAEQFPGLDGIDPEATSVPVTSEG